MKSLFGYMQSRTKFPETCRAPSRRRKGAGAHRPGACVCASPASPPAPTRRRGLDWHMAQPPANSPHSPRLSSSPSQPNFSRATGDRSGQTGSSARTAGASQGCAGAHMAPAPPGPCSHWGKEDASDTCSGEPGKLKQSNLLGVDYFFSPYIYTHIFIFFFPALCARRCSSHRRPHPTVQCHHYAPAR